MSSSRNSVSQKLINLLEQFSVDEETKPVRDHAKTLLNSLIKFNELDEKQQNKDIVSLRKTLLDYYNNQNLPIVYIADIDFKKLLCNILITLAEQFTVNEIDPVTSLPLDPISWLPIDESDRFVTLTGQSFSIDYIIKYNSDRLSREDSLGEEANEKYLLNPLTNQPFSPIDAERLIIIAGKKKKDLDFVIDRPSDSKMGPAEMSQAFSLKDIASIAKGKSIKYDINITKELNYTPGNALACMQLCALNNETQTFSYLYGSLEQPYKDVLTRPNVLEVVLEMNSIITQDSAKAFTWLLTNFNEPKTLKIIADLNLAAGNDVNPSYQKGMTAFHLAAQCGFTEVIKVLLDPKYNININLRKIDGATAAMTAVEDKHIDVVKLLAEKKANLMIPCYDGRAPIHIAAKRDDTELMQLLLDHKANLNQKSEVLTGLETAAHYAAQHNSKKVTQMLLDAGADFTITNAEGHAPLHLAAYFGSTDVMQVLLQHKDKVSPDQVAEGPLPHTVATTAAENGKVSILKLLAEEKISLDQPRRDDETTPLHRAALFGHYEATAFLIDHYLTNHKNIFVTHKAGQSPFLFACDFACKKGNWEVAKLFLNKS